MKVENIKNIPLRSFWKKQDQINTCQGQVLGALQGNMKC